MAKHANINSLMIDIADAIRRKTGDSAAIKADTFPAAIKNIVTGSPNGKKWTRSNITSAAFHSIHYANGMWVACSNEEGLYYYSTDGMTWTQSNITTGYFNDVYNANGIWVAGGRDGYDTSSISYYSTDGMTWDGSINVSSYDFIESIHNANGIWVGAGFDSGLWYSTNGMKWNRSNVTAARFYCIHNANGIWIAGGSDGLYYSIGWAPTDNINQEVNDNG